MSELDDLERRIEDLRTFEREYRSRLIAYHRDRLAELGADLRPETAIRLLEEAFHLRMNGERAPGGNETWQDWDQRCEEFLRDVDTTSSPKRNREAQ